MTAPFANSMRNGMVVPAAGFASRRGSTPSGGGAAEAGASRTVRALSSFMGAEPRGASDKGGAATSPLRGPEVYPARFEGGNAPLKQGRPRRNMAASTDGKEAAHERDARSSVRRRPGRRRR